MWEIICTWWPWMSQCKNFHKKIRASPIYSDLIWCPRSRCHALGIEKRLCKNMDLISHQSGSDWCEIQVHIFKIGFSFSWTWALHSLFRFDMIWEILCTWGPWMLQRRNLLKKMRASPIYSDLIWCPRWRYHALSIWNKTLEKSGLDIAPVWIRLVRNPGPHF